MLDDFRNSSAARASRGRFAGSMSLAVALYGGFAVAMVAATADVHPPVEVPLEPADKWPRLPEPEAPTPPTVRPEEQTRSGSREPRRTPPPRESATRHPESDKPLVDDDFGGGTHEGPAIAAANATPAPAPQPPPLAPLIRPRDLPGNRYSDLEYPRVAIRQGISGIVVIAFDVLEDGRVSNPRVLSGPVEFHATVIEAARSWRFEPARRGGKAVRSRLIKRVIFRLEDA